MCCDSCRSLGCLPGDPCTACLDVKDVPLPLLHCLLLVGKAQHSQAHIHCNTVPWLDSDAAGAQAVPLRAACPQLRLHSGLQVVAQCQRLAVCLAARKKMLGQGRQGTSSTCLQCVPQLLIIAVLCCAASCILA